MIWNSENKLIPKSTLSNNLKPLCFICNKSYPKNIKFNPCNLPTLYSLTKSTQPLQSKTLELNSSLSNNKMLIPCECNKYAHQSCLHEYCLFNLSYTCSKCNMPFNVNITYHLSPLWKIIKLIMVIAAISLIHFILLLIGMAIMIFRFISLTDYAFWNIYLGLIIIALAIISYTKLLLFFIKLYKEEGIVLSLSFLPYLLNSNPLIINETVIDYLLKHRSMTYMSLLESRMTNELYKESNIEDEQRLNSFIKENNTAIHLMNSKLSKEGLQNNASPLHNLNEQFKMSLRLEESLTKIYPKIEGIVIKSIYDSNQDRNELRKEIPNSIKSQKENVLIHKSKTKICCELPKKKIMHKYSMTEIKGKPNFFSPQFNVTNCNSSDRNPLINKVRDSVINEVNPFFYSITNSELLEQEERVQIKEDQVKNSNFEDEQTSVFGENHPNRTAYFK